MPDNLGLFSFFSAGDSRDDLCVKGRMCPSLQAELPRYFRLTIRSLDAEDWEITPAHPSSPCFPPHILRRIFSLSSLKPEEDPLLSCLNFFRWCGKTSGEGKLTDLLTEMDKSVLDALYLWIAQRVQHFITEANVVRDGAHSPRWSPLTFFHPSNNLLSAVYFQYDPVLNFTQTGLKYLFDPVLEYLRSLLTDGPGHTISLTQFLNPQNAHSRHSSSTNWSVRPPLLSQTPPFPSSLLDTLCNSDCWVCRALGLDYS